ncbi:MAG: hypothetical protein DDT33_01289 [Firmicutes bacterium]|nr:hypothetical protein [Bacillota bacterium]
MYDPDIEATYKRLKGADPRRAAEAAYVIAVISKRQGDFTRAKQFAKESIQLFESLNIQTLEEAAARYLELNGVFLPEYIHENVVRDRFKDLLHVPT